MPLLKDKRPVFCLNGESDSHTNRLQFPYWNWLRRNMGPRFSGESASFVPHHKIMRTDSRECQAACELILLWQVERLQKGHAVVQGPAGNRHPQPSTVNPQPSTLNPQSSTLNPQPSTLNPQPSSLNPQPSTLNPQPSTLNPQPSNLNTQPSTLYPQPSTLDPEPELLNPKPYTLHSTI